MRRFSLSFRLYIALSVTFTAASSSYLIFSPSSSFPFSLKSSSLSPPPPHLPRATHSDLLSLLGPEDKARVIDPKEAQQLRSCFKFLVPFNGSSLDSKSDEYSIKRRFMVGKRLWKYGRQREEEENEMIWWPPAPVLDLARLAVDSGGDPDAIHRALDPTVIQVPDVDGSKENQCELTRTPYGRRFINEELNSYLASLFELIACRGPMVGLNISLSRFDLFHGHLFLATESGRLGILFHAKEYPAYDKEDFPYNMGYCQKGSNVAYDDSMNLRNILWLAPLPSNSSNTWLAPGVLVVLDAHPGGIIYGDLIPEYVRFARTLYEVVSKDIYAEEDSAITRMLQSLAVPILGNVCHVFMHGFNSVQVYGAEKLHQVLLHRPKDKPLITVSNHVASMDDPLVIASLLPPRVIMEAHNLRWTLCATDRCFKNPVASAFFKCVKVLPVSRGDGLYQKGLDMAISKLNSGGWVHIFPEGSRSRDGGRTVGSAKRGVGRLVLDADNTPIVVPFVHTGMQEIVPIGATFPRIGKTVTVLIGDPISFDDLLKSRVTELASRENLCDVISSRIGNRLRELKARVDQLALEQSTRTRNLAPSIADKAMVFLQQVDWELFGISNWIVSPDDSTAKQEKSQEQQIYIHRKLPTSDRRYQMKAMIEEGIRSRIRGCLESTEMTVFAGRSFLLNQRKNKYVDVRYVSPLQAWKPYVDANWQRQWNYAAVVW